MSLALVAAIGAAGGLGSVGRYLLDRRVTSGAGDDLPLGILAVNLSGAFLIGLVAGWGLSEDASRVVVTGLLGGYTTLSTWMFQSQRLHEEGRGRVAVANLLLSLALGLLLAWLGREIGSGL